MKKALAKNPVKQKIIKGETVYGLYVGIPSQTIIELAGNAGFDFVRIDLCHASVDKSTIEDLIRAAEVSGTAPMFRVNNEPFLIEYLLEVGAMGLVVPGVDSYESAKKAVDAVRYPPMGKRGIFSACRAGAYGSVSGGDYTIWSNSEVLLGVQIENAEAVANVTEICTLEGIDMILSGRGDLAQSLGLTGQKNHPQVLELEEKIFAVAKSFGKYVSVNLDPTGKDFSETITAWRKRAQVITLGHDLNLFRNCLGNVMKTVRQDS